MSKTEFVSAWRHEIDGWILDACLDHRAGAELSMFLKTMRARIEAKLGAIYDSLSPVPPALANRLANGVHTNGGHKS